MNAPCRVLRALLCLLPALLACQPAWSAWFDDDAVALDARITRLEDNGALDEAGKDTLAAARQLLGVAADRVERVDALVQQAIGADVALAGLEDEILSLRPATIKQSDNAATDADDAGTIALGSERDALDAAIGRARREAASLEQRAPAILSALARLRGDPWSGDFSSAESDLPIRDETDLNGRLRVGGELAREVHDAARRLERRVTIESLSREVGTLAPRARVADARLRLLESRRSRVSRQFARHAADEDRTHLADADARIDRLNSLLDDPASTAQDHEQIASALVRAQRIRELVTAGSALRTADAALERRRRALADAETSASSVLASGEPNEAEGELLQRVEGELPSLDVLEESLDASIRDTEQLRQERALFEDELRELESRSAVPHEDTRVVIEALSALVDTTRWRGEQLQRRTLVLSDLVERSRSLAILLERRLLWLRQTDRLGKGLLVDLRAGVRWMTDPHAWSGLLDELRPADRGVWWQLLGALILAMALVVLRRRLRARRAALAERVGKVGQDGYWVTPEAIALAVPLALPVPLTVAAVGSVLTSTDRGADGVFTWSVGAGLLALAALMLVIDFFRRQSRDHGVLVAHFGWDAKAASALDRYLKRFLRVQMPLTLLLTMTLASDLPELRYGLGLVIFVIASLSFGLLVGRIVRPRAGVLAMALPRERVSLRSHLAAAVLVALPVGVGLLPLAGYFDAAIELQARVFRTGLLVLSAALLHGLLLRLYYVAWRRYSLRWVRARRAEQLRARDTEHTGDAVPNVIVSEGLAPEPLAGQARAVLMAVTLVATSVGLWWLWAPIVPALGIADEIVLWQRTRSIDGAVVNAPVTLWSLMLATSLIVGGLLAARNLRGLLQVGLVQRLDVDPGTRYAIVTIAGYAALGIGLVTGLSQLGIDWSKLQWIVAALGVGLGFGLQEVVANFVSGLIVLVERPVRVGDVVTIGELEGTVSAINIRATTITDFENREVLLPNKSIITENVTNWTLHDSITRLLLTVRVARDSDIQKVRDLLMDVVESHAGVLANPAPTVFFLNHGAGSRDFELRVFVSSVAERLQVTHDLNTAIYVRLAEAGIAIPFPQSDVHVYTSDDRDANA